MRKILIFTILFTLTTSIYAQNNYPNVVVPDLPKTLEFAGEKVPLSNFDVREALEREILVTTNMHSRTMQTILNSRRYISIIEPIMKNNGIPRDLIYLCMAESGLNPNAVSPAGAAGLWQIMPAVGKQYGLEVRSDVDERFHIEKCTDAACKYLKSAYVKFGSWALAAASYNGGVTGVSTRITKQGVKSYYDAFFPEETMRYVYRILSFKLLCENPAAYGYQIAESDYHKPFSDYRENFVSGKNINWSVVAQEHGTTYKMLRELNHWIRSYEHPNAAGVRYKVKFPNKDFRE